MLTIIIKGETDMKIKLKRLHEELTHVWSGIGHYHDSSRSLYGYKQYRIKTRDIYMGWEVYDGETQISDSNGFGFTFKEAREWLENYLDKNEK
jgi:hypothetical protein